MARRGPLMVALVVALVLSLLAGFLLAYSVPSLAGTSGVPVVGSVAIGHLPPGTDVSLSLGFGEGSESTAANGEGFEVRGRENTSGLLYAWVNGAPQAMQIVPKLDGVTFREQELGAESTAVAMMFLAPAMAQYPVLTNGIYMGGAYKSPVLRQVVQAIEAQWASGSNPITMPGPEVLTAVAALIADVDASVLLRLGASDEPVGTDASATATGTGGPVQTLGELGLGAPRGLGTMRPVTARGPAQSTSTALLAEVGIACESEQRINDPCGIDEVYVNSREGALNESDRAAVRCAAARPGSIQDLDGLEGDQACVMLNSVADDRTEVNLAAVNFVPRWLLAYESTNGGLYPDAVIDPKTWQLPSAVELTEIIARGAVAANKDVVEALLGWAGIEVDIGERENVVRYYQEVFDSFFRNGYTPFGLPIGDEGTGIEFATFGPALGNAGASTLESRRLAISWAMTALTQFIVPATQLALDLAQGKSLRRAIGRGESDISPDDEWRFVWTELALALVSTAATSWAECQGQQEDCMVREDESLADFAGRLGTVFVLLMQEAFRGGRAQGDGAGDVADELVVPGGSSVRVEDWRRGRSEARKEATSGGIGLMLRYVLSGGDPEILRDGVQDLAKEAVGVALQSAVAATPVGKALQAYAAVSDAAGIGLAFGELVSDMQNLSPIDRYRIDPVALGDSPTSSEAESTVSLPRDAAVDMIVVIDASTSMDEPVGEDATTRFAASLDAAEALIEVIRDDSGAGSGESRLGVVTFNDVAQSVVPLTPVSGLNPSWRDLLTTGGEGTNIGEALKTAIDALRLAGDNRRILLLTDGEDNQFGAENIVNMLVGSNTLGDADTTYAVVDKRIVIDTVAFDFQGDEGRRLLQDVADVSGGRYFSAGSALSLAGAFIKSRQLLQGDLIREETGTFEGGEAKQSVQVEPDAAGRLPIELVTSAYSPSGLIEVEVINPDGDNVENTPGVRVIQGLVTRVIVDKPAKGIWTFVMRLAPGAGAEVDGAEAEGGVSVTTGGTVVPAVHPASGGSGFEDSPPAGSGEPYYFVVTRSGGIIDTGVDETVVTSPDTTWIHAIVSNLVLLAVLVTSLAVLLARGAVMRRQEAADVG